MIFEKLKSLISTVLLSLELINKEYFEIRSNLKRVHYEKRGGFRYTFIQQRLYEICVYKKRQCCSWEEL